MLLFSGVARLSSFLRHPALLPAVAAISVGATVLGAIIFALIYQSQASWVRHTLEVEREISRLRSTVQVGELAARNYILSDDDSFLPAFSAASIDAPMRVETLDTLTRDNPEQRQAVTVLKGIVRDKLDDTSQAIGMRRAGDTQGAIATFVSGRGRALMDQIDDTLDKMEQREAGLMVDRTAEAGNSAIVLILIGVLTVGLSVLSIYLWLRDRRSANLAVEKSLAEQEALVAGLRAAQDETKREIELKNLAEMKLRQIQKMEAVGQLTGGVAHDFNNMLAVIMSAITLSRKRIAAKNFDIGAMMDAAMDAANRAAKLTSRLLAFSRQQPLAPEPLDAGRFISGMTDILQRTLSERIQVETVLGGGLWKVNVDISQLENAILNLAVNARDAMPEGGKLTLETANASLDDVYARANVDVAAGQYVMIAVSDSGMGMPPEVIERAFDPFYTTKPVGQGTGLGLSQVFGFVKQSGGHVKIYSEPAKGTAVKIYLPRYFGGRTETVRAPAAIEDLRSDEICETILVVEDEHRLREVSSAGLRDLGYTILEAPNGAEALKVLDANPGIHCLFTDIMMPDMTGRQLADEARRRRPELKVLYTTGYTRNAVVHNGVLDPGVNFLPKPFTLEELARKVREVLGKPA